MGWIVVFLFSFFMVFGSVLAYALGDTKTELIVIAVLFFMSGVCSLKKYRDKKTGRTAERKRKKKEIKEENARVLTGKHLAGLPLSEGCSCRIAAENDGFVFAGGGNEFHLKKNKITDIDVKTDAEIKRQYVSSAGGAVAGGMVFGPLGAIVLGRAKEKKTTTITHFLIFTYRSDQNVDYISFEIPYCFLSKARKWKREFSNQAPGSRTGHTIEL